MTKERRLAIQMWEEIVSKLSVHSCKRTGEAHDMIKYLSKAFTKSSIARVFGYSKERIRQICVESEE